MSFPKCELRALSSNGIGPLVRDDSFTVALDHVLYGMLLGRCSGIVAAISHIGLGAGHPPPGVGESLKRRGLWRVALEPYLGLIGNGPVLTAAPPYDCHLLVLFQKGDMRLPNTHNAISHKHNMLQRPCL